MLYLRVGVTALALTLLGAASFQKPDDKKPSDKKPDDKAPVKARGQLPPNFKKLGLRDDQIQKVYRIRGDYKAKQDELRAKLEKLRSEEREAVEKVLTPDQLKHSGTCEQARSPPRSEPRVLARAAPQTDASPPRLRRATSPPRKGAWPTHCA